MEEPHEEVQLYHWLERSVGAARAGRVLAFKNSEAERNGTEKRFKSWTPFNLIQTTQSWKINGSVSLAGVYIKIILILNKTAQNDARSEPLWTV